LAVSHELNATMRRARLDNPRAEGEEVKAASIDCQPTGRQTAGDPYQRLELIDASFRVVCHAQLNSQNPGEPDYCGISV
jgi:hypothetical protein